MTIKLSPEAWRRMLEADEKPINKKALDEFVARVEKFTKENPNFVIKEITEIDDELS